MRSADASPRPQTRAARHARKSSILLSLGLVLSASALALPQSGRTPAPPAPTSTPPPGDTRPRQVNKDSQRELPPAFIVATAPPDGSQEKSPYLNSMYGLPDFEEVARGACFVALRNLDGVKRVIGDANVARWEARETALGEDEAYVVWLELNWVQSTPQDGTPFRLRYLLFEPRTGKIVSSGYGRGTRQTWGRPLQRGSIFEQLRNAGQDIADQVVSELSKTP